MLVNCSIQLDLRIDEKRMGESTSEYFLWSYDGRYIAACGNGRPDSQNRKEQIWDTSTGKKTVVDLYGPNNKAYNVHAVAWSPYNKALVAFGSDNNKVSIYDRNSDKVIFTYQVY